jgi:hypothetical protein
MAGTGASLIGTAHHKAVHDTISSLVGGGPILVGSALRYRVHTSIGALTGSGADLSGAAGLATGKFVPSDVLWAYEPDAPIFTFDEGFVLRAYETGPHTFALDELTPSAGFSERPAVSVLEVAPTLPVTNA